MPRQRRDGHRPGSGKIVVVRHDPRQPESEHVGTVPARDRAQREFPGEARRLVQREDPASCADDGGAPDQNLDPRGGHGRAG